MFNYDDIYMPCWQCPYGHSCKYYDSPLWDEWILINKICPANIFSFNSIYEANINKMMEIEEKRKERKLKKF